MSTHPEYAPDSILRDLMFHLAVLFPAEYEAALKQVTVLEAAEADLANPCGTYTQPYVSPYTAKSAAEVAEGVPNGHLPQSRGGDVGHCTWPGCHDHPTAPPSAVMAVYRKHNRQGGTR